jgi:glycosyltransferase involved in cell wall biosynthesis
MDGRIRIVKFLSVFMIGGTERQFVNVVKNLDPSKFDVQLACFRKFGAFLPEIEACGRPITAFSVNSLYSYKTVLAQLRFMRYLREHRVQVLHTYGLYPNLFAIPAARMAGVPVTIASVRDMGAHASEIHRKAQRLVCKMATCVLTNAEAVRGWLIEQGVAQRKIRVIRNGIIPSDLGLIADPTVREEFGIPADAPLIGAVCRLNPVKGVDYLIEAAAVILRRHPQARFMIVGDGDYKRHLVAHAERLGIDRSMIFTGFRTDAMRLVRAFDVSVLPSLSEGLSNTLMESMSAGLPVVATRVGGAAELVVDGVSGFLVEPRDAATLAERISGLIENCDAARRIGEAARRRMLEEFSMEQTVRQTEGLYCELMGKRSRTAQAA